MSLVDASPSAPPEQPPGAPLPSLWRNRDFMLLWSGQFVSTLGSAASQVVFPLLILAITNSPAAAGIAGALYMLPYALFSLPAGALIDRWDRKRVMILCDTGRALVFASIPAALALNVLTVWQLYVTTFLEGTLFVFFNIAEAAALPQVVSKAQLPQAAAQNQSTSAVAWVVGPSIGAFLYQGVSRMAPFIADAISYAVSVVSLHFVKADFQRERPPTEGRSLRREIAEGLRWLWAQSLVRFMAFLGGGLNFISASHALILIVLAKNLGAPDGAIGLIFSIGAIGGIVGSVIAAPVQKRLTLRQSIAGSMWAVALAYPLYVLAPNIYVLGAITAVIYTTFPIVSVVAYSYRAALVPDELQGRVNSSFRLISWGTQPFGAFLGGLLIERAGVAPSVLVFSALWLLLAALATFNPGMRAAGRFEDTHPN